MCDTHHIHDNSPHKGLEHEGHDQEHKNWSRRSFMHERAWLYSHVDQVKVRCVVELHGKDHGTKLRERLLREGYPISWGIGLE